MSIAYIADVLGQIESSRQEWELAERYFNQAISGYEQIGDCRRIAQAQYHFAHTLFQQNKREEVTSLLNKALAIFQELQLEHEIVKVQQFLKNVKGGA